LSGTQSHRWQLRRGRAYGPKSRAFVRPVVRAIGSALAFGALLLALLPTAASAASFNPQLNIGIGNCSVDGWNAGSTKTVVLTWKDSDGGLKNKQTVTSDSGGNFSTNCDSSEQVEVGDTIRVTIGTRSRTLTVPKLTITVDRISNTVSGQGPAGDWVGVQACERAMGCYDASEPTDGTTGAYSHDFSSDVDITGAGYARVNWTSPQGDDIQSNADAQQILIWEGRTPWGGSFNASGPAGLHFTVHLLNGSLSNIGDGQAVLNARGYSSGDILDSHGARVRAHAGDTIDATDLVSDAYFVLPAISVSGNATTDRVSGTCLPNSPFWFEAYAPDYSRDTTRSGTTDGTGFFSRKITSSMNLKRGDHIDVECTLSTGDTVAKHITVP